MFILAGQISSFSGSGQGMEDREEITSNIERGETQQVTQSWWSLGRHTAGHGLVRKSPASTTAATKLLVSFFLLEGKGLVLANCLQK